MATGDWLPVVVTAFVGPLTAWLTFRFATRQDAGRWSRDKRAEVYVEALTEASAEKDWVHREVSRVSDPHGNWSRLPDDRLGSFERRRLGARLAAFGTPEVVAAHQAFMAAVGKYMLPVTLQGVAPPMGSHWPLEEAFRKLETVIRDELANAAMQRHTLLRRRTLRHPSVP